MKGLALYLGLFCLAFLGGCGNGGTNVAEQEEQAGPMAGLRVALITPGPVNDKGWNGLAYEALMKLREDTGAEVTHQEVESRGQHEAALRDYASGGYDLVIAHGSEFGDPALEVARDFPTVHFLISAGRVSAPNVTSLIYKLEDATYILGIIAAGMSETGRAGCVGGMELPVIRSTFEGFRDGAHSMNPQMTVPFTYIGGWTDTAAARQQTTTLINQGADMIFHNADAAGIGMFQAVQEAARQGRRVYAFGSNADQNSQAVDVVLASAVLDINKGMEAVAKEVREGAFRGEVRMLGMANDFVHVAINPALEHRIPENVRELVHETEARIRSGELVVEQSA